MRSDAQAIFDKWSDPTFQPIGGNRPSGRVTVEKDWYLTTQASNVGQWPIEKLPVRWYQRADNSQEETEVPNIKAIDWERNIQNDAATCTITLNNQWMKTNFAASVVSGLGNPGYFTFNRGDSVEAISRWGHEANEWNGVLVPGALIRTYEGYGGQSKTISDAVDDGDIILTGVWIVDDIDIGSRSGLLEVRCRDMMSLLIDQILYPPLVPASYYPLHYSRWKYIDKHSTYKPDLPSPEILSSGSTVKVKFENSSVDQWYPQSDPESNIPTGGYVLHGHKGSHSLDGNLITYWLGEGNSGPDKPFAVNWIQYGLGGQMVTAIEFTPWKGGYEAYVSVKENNRWIQGGGTVPYDPTAIMGQSYWVDTGADIPYVRKLGVANEKKTKVVFKRPVRAQSIRISFRHLADSNIGPWEYRAGVREFKAYGLSSGTATSPGADRPFGWQGIEAHPTGDGFWTLSYEGKVQAFGDCVRYGDRYHDDNKTYTDIVATTTGLGYWLLSDNGYVYPFGDAVSYGSANTGDHAVALARTYTGNGYWILYRGGHIRPFGDAPTYVGIPDGASDMDSMDTDYGLWIVDDDGVVRARGAATHYGNGTPSQIEQGIIAAPDDLGYVLLGGNGGVRPLGSAIGADYVENILTVEMLALSGYRPADMVRPERIVINGAEDGAWVITTDGDIIEIGAATPWGSPKSGVVGLRRDGNMKDYVDVVKDILLWSGFFLQENIATGDPDVYGNLESTGIYPLAPLPDEMFDKKPPIDPINQIKEIVGYLFYIGSQGDARFNSPNWWAAGNFYETGEHTDYIPEIDERVQLFDYKTKASKQRERSRIIVTSNEPTANFDDTVTTTYTPSHSWLRGMQVPAMLRVPSEVTKEEQELMAELIALHIWFTKRLGSVQILGNPGIEIDDQVRIFERVVAETYIHYVRGVSSSLNLESGEYTMNLTTNWLGTEDGNWAITAQSVPVEGQFEPVPQGTTGLQFIISERLSDYVARLGRRGGYTDPYPTTRRDVDTNNPFDDGAGAE